MVSEDSQDFGWLAVIHRLSNLRDLNDARHSEMNATIHEFNNPCKLLEVLPLRRLQRMFLKERDDNVPQVRESTDVVTGEILPVVVVTPVHVHMTASEKAVHVIQDCTATRRLDNHKSGLNLPTKPRTTVSENGTAETAFAIDKTDNPSVVQESFLLVFRIPHIFTAVHTRRSTATLCHFMNDE
jgi:hypothetical protein